MPGLGFLDEPEELGFVLRTSEEEPVNLAVRNQLMDCALRKGDWADYVYQAMGCAELEQLAGRRESGRILGLEDLVGLEARQLVATVKPEVYLRIGEYHLDGGRPDQAESF